MSVDSEVKGEAEVEAKSEVSNFKDKMAHFNKLTSITKFMDKQPKNIHIHVKNIIQTNDAHLLNDSTSGINVNISELSTESFDQILEYMAHIKSQNDILTQDQAIAEKMHTELPETA
jgi:hypothetical protein